MFSQHIARMTRWTREPVTRPRWSYALGLLASVAIIAVGVAGFALTRPARTDAAAGREPSAPIAACMIEMGTGKVACFPASQYGFNSPPLSPSAVCRRYAAGSLQLYYPPVSKPFYCVGRRAVPGVGR
jgi:hypothetical protein